MRHQRDGGGDEQYRPRGYVGVWLALCDFDRDGNVNGDWDLSSPEPAAHGELVLVHYFFFCFLGGVTGRPVLMPP